MTSQNGHKHAIVYDRGSTRMQKENWSRDDAARIGRELAERNDYTWELRQEIKSGETLEDRPVMLGILKDIEAGKVQAIICQDFTRLSRDEDGIDGRMIRRICRDNNCRIITQQKVFDFSQDADHDMSDFEFLIGKIHKRQVVRAMMRGLKERARQGYLIGWFAKLGYQRIPTGEVYKDKAIYWPEVVPSEAGLVRTVFDAVIQAGTPNAAARWLNQQGYRRPFKYDKRRKKSTGPDREWTRNDVKRIVNDPVYTGWIVYGRRTKSRYMLDLEEQRRYYPELRIIDQVTWQRVQDIIHTTTRVHYPHNGKPYPFTGLLCCTCCGRGLTGHIAIHKRGSNVYRYRLYNCKGRSLGMCARPESVSEIPVARALIPLVARELEKVGGALRPALDAAARERSTGGLRDRLIAETQAELAEVERQIDNLAQAVASGVLQGEQAKRTSQELAEKKQRLAGKVYELQERLEIEAEFRRAIEHLSGDIEAALWQMFEIAPGQLGQLLRFMFKPASISVRKTGEPNHRRVEIVGHQFTDDFAGLTSLIGHGQNAVSSAKPNSEISTST